MRASILMLFFIVILFGKANSQILELGNKWIYDYRDYSILNGTYTEKFDSIEIVSDTLINNLIYYKLLASQQSPCGIFTSVEYLREDDDKIYRLSNNLIDENLMMDFTNQISYDMTYESSGFNSDVQTTVFNDSIGSEILSSGEQITLTYQRIINNSSFEDNALYKLSKDIGYIEYGLLFPDIGTGLCDVYQNINLRCKISGNDTIRVTEFDCYETSIISSTIDVVDREPIIYPNPTHGTVNVEGDYEILSIQNSSGTYMEFTGLENKIYFSGFPNGIYIITTKRNYDKRINTYKIIKM
jgi:hypothetical protein